MALARSRREGMNYWPGFVDALSTLILGIIFLLTVFVVVQFVLSQEVTGKDTALAKLSARISQLTDLLGLEQSNKVSLEDQIAQLRANLATTDAVAEVLPPTGGPVTQGVAMATKPVQDRFTSSAVNDAATPAGKSTRTAEVLTPTASVAAAPAQ